MSLPPPLASRLLLGVVVLLVAAPARAQTDEELGASLSVDLPVTLGAGVVWVGGEALRDLLAPATCQWCTPGPADATVARAAVWARPSVASTLSDVGVYGVLPLVAVGGVLAMAVGREGRLWPRVGWDLLLVAEAVALAQALNQAVKFLVARERPFVHWLGPSEKALTAAPSDNNLSFYSGHTDVSFALVASAWTVARMRGYSWANVMLAVGLPLAAGVGYLRMAAGKHYLSDVLVGAVLGSAVGVLVPAVHRWGRFLAPRGATATVSLIPLPGGGLATLGWVF